MKSTKHTSKQSPDRNILVYLGAGKDRKDGWKHADAYAFKGIDYVFDATGKFPFKANSIIKYFTQDFLEHIPPEKSIHVIKEMHRTLVVGGIMEHIVPYGGSNNDLSSPLHLSHWTITTFEHFEEGNRRFEIEKGLIGWKEKGFELIETEEMNIKDGIPQGIHVVMKKV